MGACIAFCDDDSGFSCWNDVSSVNGGGDDRRLGGHGLLDHSGWDGGFAVGHGANSDVGCDGIRGGNRCGDGRDSGGEGSSNCLSLNRDNRGCCGCRDRSPGFTASHFTLR